MSTLRFIIMIILENSDVRTLYIRVKTTLPSVFYVGIPWLIHVSPELSIGRLELLDFGPVCVCETSSKSNEEKIRNN